MVKTIAISSGKGELAKLHWPLNVNKTFYAGNERSVA